MLFDLNIIIKNKKNWHELRWVHRFDTAELFVDGIRVNGTEIVGLYRKLDLHFEVDFLKIFFKLYCKFIFNIPCGIIFKIIEKYGIISACGVLK